MHHLCDLARARLDDLDARVRTGTLLLLFWTLFWLLNGLDKFFNRPTFFGVTRDAAFVEYFARLGLPSRPALASLYACGVYEILLAAGFGAALLLGVPSLARLSLKASALLFIVFSAADVLFGDRRELWEHGTFLALVLVSLVVLEIERGRAPGRGDLDTRRPLL